MSGIPSRAFPFTEDPDVHLALADELGTRYVLLDEWDALANRYVGGAVARRPGAFCFVRGFGEQAEGGAQLLGILPSTARSRGRSVAGGEVDIAPCPAGYVSSHAREMEQSERSRGPSIRILADSRQTSNPPMRAWW